MSFLPYAPAHSGVWWLAGSGSALVHAGLIGLAVASAQGLITLAAPAPPKPKYTITLTPLDSDTIAGNTLQEGEAGAEGLDGPDALSAVTAAETLAALTPQSASISTEPSEKLAAIEPEIAAPPQASQPIAPIPERPEATSPLMPDRLAPKATEAPVQSVTPAAPIQPLRPTVVAQEPSVSASVAPAAVTPLRPAVAAAPVAVTPPRAPEPSAPATAPTPQTAAPSAQDLAIADLLRRIRTAPPEDCFLALPRRDGDTGVGIALITKSEAAIARFNQAVLTEDDTNLRQTRTFVDDRQCAALNYIRQNQDYPATKLGLRLNASLVPSGGLLTGSLRGTAGRYLTLLLIDNNGVVQDLQRFLTFSGNETRFEVPVTRAGPPRDTGQLLLAIATTTPAPNIRARSGQLAQDVFRGLVDPLATQAALAVATFDVESP